MSAPTLPADPGIRAGARLRFGGIVRAEWIKLTSLRSTTWTLLTIVGVGVGLSLALAVTMESAGIPDQPSARFALDTLTIGVVFGQLVAAVLGVLAMSGEYSTKMIQSTLAAVPMRLPVLAAKALVLFGLVTGIGLLTLFGSWAATYPMFDGLDLAVGLGEPGFVIAMIGAAVYLGLTATFALGIGAILRSAAGGIATVLGILLILPIGLSMFAGSIEWFASIPPYLLSSAGEAMSRVPEMRPAGAEVHPGALLAPGAGALVVLAWTTVSLTIGALTLRGRDA